MRTVFRFSIAVALLALVGCAEHPTYYEKALRAERDGLVQAVRYGYHDDTLLFIVFESSYTRLRHIGFQDIPRGGSEMHLDRWIVLPDKTKQDLPTSKMMFEYRVGEFSNRPVDVTLAEFKSFLATHPGNYSIHQLEEYIGRGQKAPDEVSVNHR